jgi:O-antigen/teichoic acid export membrane protein
LRSPTAAKGPTKAASITSPQRRRIHSELSPQLIFTDFERLKRLERLEPAERGLFCASAVIKFLILSPKNQEGHKLIRQNNIFQTEHIESELKRVTVHGGLVTVAAQACLFALGMGSTMVLARLLTPSDFGLIAMVSVVTGFVTLFKDLGLSAATIQRENIDHTLISTLFWLNLALSVAIMLLFFVLAPVVAWFYGEPRLKSIMFALAGAFVFGGLAVQHQALLRRQMRFIALAGIEITSRVCGIFVAIVSTWYGAGYWALVFMQITTAVVSLAGVWMGSAWRPGRPMWHADIRSMVVFGGNLTGFNIINYFARNFDQLLIGWYWGAQPVGLYNRAYQLLLLPIQQINAPLAQVAIPALSRLQHDPLRYRLYYCKAMNLIAFITTPLIVSMLVLSDEIIMVVLGQQWLETSSIFKILAIAALGQPLANATGWVYISLGQTKRMLLWGLLSTPPLIVAFAIGLPWGAVGVAIAYAITDHLRRIPLFLFAFKDSPIKLADLVGATWRPGIISFIMWAVMLHTRAYLLSWSPGWIIFSTCVAGFIALAVSILVWPRAREETLSLFEVVNMVLPRRQFSDVDHTPYSSLKQAIFSKHN